MNQADVNLWLAKIKKVRAPDALAAKIKNDLERVKTSPQTNQWDTLTRYLDWITSLPWETATDDILDIARAQTIMDENHYGLAAIKKRILEYVSVLILEKQQGKSLSRAPILIFVGLAGTGKTTIGASIAMSLGRKFTRIAFGGLSSALDLRGASKIQPEAEPGLIIKALRQTQSKNSVILLDEIDRVAPEGRGAIMGVLVELLDPEQNRHFSDHYIDYPFDLSQTLFVATANTTANIATAVMDRLEVINMPSYTDEEKIAIAGKHLLPRLLDENGLVPGQLVIEDPVLKKIARQSGFDPGIRSIERHLNTIVRKAAYKLVNKEGANFIVNEQNAAEYLE